MLIFVFFSAGADFVEQVLTETANALESIVKQTLELINSGMRLEDIVQTVVIPPEVKTKIFLKPVYDQPEFVIRNLWRLYAGWWDGNPASLEPSPVGTLSGEIVHLCGDSKLKTRISELIRNPTKENVTLASHLVSVQQISICIYFLTNFLFYF
jgi:alkyl sulfatase BDS1-like metallo-beta-lactamase superfamily hydrolase